MEEEEKLKEKSITAPVKNAKVPHITAMVVNISKDFINTFEKNNR